MARTTLYDMAQGSEVWRQTLMKEKRVEAMRAEWDERIRQERGRCPKEGHGNGSSFNKHFYGIGWTESGTTPPPSDVGISYKPHARGILPTEQEIIPGGRGLGRSGKYELFGHHQTLKRPSRTDWDHGWHDDAQADSGPGSRPGSTVGHAGLGGRHRGVHPGERTMGGTHGHLGRWDSMTELELLEHFDFSKGLSRSPSAPSAPSALSASRSRLRTPARSELGSEAPSPSRPLSSSAAGLLQQTSPSRTPGSRRSRPRPRTGQSPQS